MHADDYRSVLNFNSLDDFVKLLTVFSSVHLNIRWLQPVFAL